MYIRGDTFTIRPVRPDEMDALLELYRLCEDFLALTPLPQASLEMVQADLALSQANGGDFCGIYDTAGTLMGIVDVIAAGFNGDPHTAFIELLMIGRPYRGGLGSSVVKAVETDIRRNSAIETIRAGVMINNPAAIRFWERHGYSIVGEAEDEPDGTTVWHLYKKLTG